MAESLADNSVEFRDLFLVFRLVDDKLNPVLGAIKRDAGEEEVGDLVIKSTLRNPPLLKITPHVALSDSDRVNLKRAFR